jgi:hypothetical protein
MLRSPHRRRVRRALSSLFREARRLQRRRRRRYAAAILLLCAIGGGGFLLASGGRPSRSGDHRAPSLVGSLTLPRSGDFFSLGVVGDRVIVSGGVGGSLFPSGSTTALSDGRAVGICDAATVESGPLRLGHVMYANCGDPALYGEQVLAVSYLAQPVSRARGLGEYAVRIAHVDPRAHDGYTLGPVVMTYDECSDCSAQWIYGDGSLWLYGPNDGGGFSPARSGEVLRVSETTGTVVERWTIPQNARELLAVDADGLWFAPSVVGGFPRHTTASELNRYESLYRVAPGAKTAARVFTIPFGSALWLVAADHTVWLESRGLHGRFELWRLEGPNGTPTFRGTYPTSTEQGVDIGEAPPTHAGNAAIGIYFVNDPGPASPPGTRQQIIHLSPQAPTQQAVATVPSPQDVTGYGAGPPGVAVGHSFYFLDPPMLDFGPGNRAPIVQGQGILYQVNANEASRVK